MEIMRGVKFTRCPMWLHSMLSNLFPTCTHCQTPVVPSGYLCVLGVREDWGLGWSARGVPMRPSARLNLTPNLLSSPKHINSHWLRVWPTASQRASSGVSVATEGGPLPEGPRRDFSQAWLETEARSIAIFSLVYKTETRLILKMPLDFKCSS